MATRRRIVGFNTPINPLRGGKAGDNDPRNFVSGNVPGQQWDEIQFAQSREALARGEPQQYSQVHTDRPAPDAVVRTVPTRMNFIPWQGSQPVAYSPTLVVPRNLGRVDLLFTVVDSAVNGLYYSFGAPQLDTLGHPKGLILVPGQPSPRFAGAVPINDLYMWTAFAGSVFLVFEGIESLEANFS